MADKIPLVNIADLVDPNDQLGRSYREVNRSKKHLHKMGEVLMWTRDDDRVFGTITNLTRDCDGTPLYTITEEHHGHSEESINEMKVIITP